MFNSKWNCNNACRTRWRKTLKPLISLRDMTQRYKGKSNLQDKTKFYFKGKDVIRLINLQACFSEDNQRSALSTWSYIHDNLILQSVLNPSKKTD